MVKCCRKALNGFSYSSLWVSTEEKLSDFYASAWQRGESGVPMLLVRLVLAALALALLGWLVAESPNPYMLIYLSDWCVIAVAALSVSSVVVSICAVGNAIPSENGVPPWYVGVYWVLFNATVSMAIIVSLLYWLLLFSAESFNKYNHTSWLEVTMHTANTALVLLELVIARTPVRMAHIYMPICLGFLYIVFTWIYYAVGGTNIDGEPIYDILDWDNTWWTLLMSSLSLAAEAAVFVMVWGVSLFRDWLTGELIRSTRYSLPYTPHDNYSA